MAFPSPCATYDDVNLVLRLYEMRREDRMRDARRWFIANCKVSTLDEQRDLCPPGSDEGDYFRMVVTYWDMAASFVARGVLHKEIFFESNREMLLVWERIKPIVEAYRGQTKDPEAWGNLEKVADDYQKWLEARGPECYPAFVKRVQG